MQNRRDELDLLLHPLREVCRLLVLPLGQPHPLQPAVDTLIRYIAWHVLERSEIAKLVDYLHLLIEAPLLGEIPDPVLKMRDLRCEISWPFSRCHFGPLSLIKVIFDRA